MTPINEAERRGRLARLLVSPPTQVAQELEHYGDPLRAAEGFSHPDEELERFLLLRGDPQINIALATNGGYGDTLKRLYEIGKELPRDSLDDKYKQGLRVSCLSNRCMSWSFTRGGFPEAWIGSEETARLMSNGDEGETAALLSNPRLADQLLVNLYERSELFEALPDARWLDLISWSARNPRIVTEIDYEDSPDLGLMSIQRAIFHFVTHAPLIEGAVHVGHHLLAALNPSQAYSPRSIEEATTAITRWKGVIVKGYKGTEWEGYWTDLSLVDELRCLIAVLYGQIMEESKDTKYKYTHRLVGSITSPDLIIRCAYYGRATMTVEQMQQGLSRDGSAFRLAALFNERNYDKRETRLFLEKELLGGYFSKVYQRRCQESAQRWKWFDPRPLSEVGVEALDRNSTRNSEELFGSRKTGTAVEQLTKRLAVLEKIVVWGLIIIGALVLWRR